VTVASLGDPVCLPPALPKESAGHLPLLRWVCLAVLLLAELLALSLRFDAGSIQSGPAWWTVLLRASPQAARLGSAIAIGIAVFAALRLRGELHRHLGHYGSGRSVTALLCGHVAALAGFTALTSSLFEGDLSTTAAAGAWVVAWLALGLVVVLLWLAAVVPPQLWPALVWHGWAVAAAGALIGAAAWGASRYTGLLWEHLRFATFWLVALLLNGLFPGQVLQPADSVIGTDSFLVEIAPQCSGCEGIGLVLGFLAVYLLIFRRELRFPAALWLLPLGAALAWLLNAVRIATLVTIGTSLSPEVALGGFHSQAGWLAFNGVALGLVALMRHSRLFAKAEVAAGPTEQSNPAAPYLVPFLVLVAVHMGTAALSADATGLYPLRVLATAAVLWYFRASYARLAWRVSGAAVGLGVLVFAVWLGLDWLLQRGADDTILPAVLNGMAPGSAAVWLAFRIVGSVVTVPVAEELAFRGYLIRRLSSADFEAVPPGQLRWLPLLVSSALFGLLHGQWLAGTAAGLCYGLALYRRGNLIDAVAAHAVTNALIAVFVLGTGAWHLWA
jgi:exosortase E/protease (VPEID-CTERM system)